MEGICIIAYIPSNIYDLLHANLDLSPYVS